MGKVADMTEKTDDITGNHTSITKLHSSMKYVIIGFVSYFY